VSESRRLAMKIKDVPIYLEGSSGLVYSNAIQWPKEIAVCLTRCSTSN